MEFTIETLLAYLNGVKSRFTTEEYELAVHSAYQYFHYKDSDPHKANNYLTALTLLGDKLSISMIDEFRKKLGV